MELLRLETGFDHTQMINLLILIMVSSGIFGFLYETLFYRIDLGYFVKRGSTYGPWIPIYLIGGGVYTLLIYRFKENPLLVFFLCMLVSGIMEYATGWFLYTFFKVRLWDYNTEIWNFGNIKGYVCLRSVLFFGVSGLLLVFVVIPLLVKVVDMSDTTILTVFCGILAGTFAADCALYNIRHRLRDRK